MLRIIHSHSQQTEGVNIEYNKEKVKNIRIVEHHLERKGKQAIFDMDLLWIKFWIKDVFITHAMSRERIELWRNSFPEVNDRWREIYISSDYLHRAIVAETRLDSVTVWSLL